MEGLGIKKMFGIYKGKKVLITGATGFKGSWLTFILEKLGAKVRGFGLQPDTEPNLYGIFGYKNRNDITIHNILEPGYTDRIAGEIKPDIVFHLASQPLVSESYRDPSGTFITNITGLINLLETARNYAYFKNLIVVTSDKCYSTEYGKTLFAENDALGGLDPYSASKACAEIVTKSYYNSFLKERGMTVVTARAGNIIGGGDWSKDRLIPDIARAVSEGKKIILRNPGSVRPWQHVFDALCGYLTVGERILNGKINGFNSYNFGPVENDAVKVIDIAERFAERLGIGKNEISVNAPEFYETETLRLDSSKVLNETGWKGVWNTEESVDASADWYRTYYRSKEEIVQYSEVQLENYLSGLQNKK